MIPRTKPQELSANSGLRPPDCLPKAAIVARVRVCFPSTARRAVELHGQEGDVPRQARGSAARQVERADRGAVARPSICGPRRHSGAPLTRRPPVEGKHGERRSTQTCGVSLPSPLTIVSAVDVDRERCWRRRRRNFPQNAGNRLPGQNRCKYHYVGTRPDTARHARPCGLAFGATTESR